MHPLLDIFFYQFLSLVENGEPLRYARKHLFWLIVPLLTSFRYTMNMISLFKVSLIYKPIDPFVFFHVKS